MPQFSRALDVYQGYNYKKDKQTPVGYITALKLGTTQLAVDQTVKDPTNPTTDLPVVAVLNHYLWETGVTDSMYFSGQVSTANKQTIAQMLLGDFSNMEVLFKFTVYEYDPLAKKYYKSAFVDADLKGLLEKNGNELNLSVADDPSSEVQSPKNFSVQAGIKPQSQAQTCNLAVASTAQVTKAWGIKEGA